MCLRSVTVDACVMIIKRKNNENWVKIDLICIQFIHTENLCRFSKWKLYHLTPCSFLCYIATAGKIFFPFFFHTFEACTFQKSTEVRRWMIYECNTQLVRMCVSVCAIVKNQGNWFCSVPFNSIRCIYPQFCNAAKNQWSLARVWVFFLLCAGSKCWSFFYYFICRSDKREEGKKNTQSNGSCDSVCAMKNAFRLCNDIIVCVFGLNQWAKRTKRREKGQQKWNDFGKKNCWKIRKA